MRTFSKLFALTLILGLLSAPITTAAAYDDDDQPHMQAALEALQNAQRHLEQAKHDKGGHRAKALEETREAIKHVEAGMKVGEQHEHHK